MSDNDLPAILASEVQAILAKGVPISIDVINCDEVYLATITVFETHARTDGQYLGLLIIDGELVATNNPTDMVRIIKGIIGDFDNLSIHDTSTNAERSAVEEAMNGLMPPRN